MQQKKIWRVIGPKMAGTAPRLPGIGGKFQAFASHSAICSRPGTSPWCTIEPLTTRMGVMTYPADYAARRQESSILSRPGVQVSAGRASGPKDLFFCSIRP